MTPAHALSVALVTRNRVASLRRTLVSLRDQEAQPFEVVISDDSDGDQAPDTEAVAREFGCRYVRGPRRGLYANRNHAASVCAGTHIRTMDDDHEFPPGHVGRCMDAVRLDPTSVWVIGEYYPGQVPNGPPPCPGQLTPRGYSVTPSDPDRCWSISCGASIYPREVFDRAGGNAEYFKFGALYLELGSRLHWLGYRIRNLATTYVIHHYDVRSRSFMELETDLASQFFAMKCHARLYQPTFSNRAWAAVETLKVLALHRRTAWRAWRAAQAAYVAHRPKVLARRATRALV